ncbi:unnamed protein product [Paramecium sonneborni]|uniref:RRM domain-containing protein n=1 Tax=Paramecium sonneborni TaxID=65129 RepID=A0A8S1Q622_9CILI|nr:unnamed protein product [Paramecium sonneborni]
MNPFVTDTLSMAQIKSINSRTIQIDNATNIPKNIKFLQQIQNSNGIYVLYATQQEAKEAQQQLNNQEFHASLINEVEQEVYTISVLNIPHTTNQSLQQAFSIFGDIAYITILKDDDGESKGVGYVTFQNKAAYDKAIIAKTLIFEDNILTILQKQPIHIMENRFKQLKLRQQQIDKKKLKHNKIDNVKISQVETNLDLELKNEMRTSGRVIRKKIKKIKSKVGDDDFALVAKMKQFKKGIQKKQDQFFRIPSQLKAKREQRKLKMEQNRKKANKIHKM